MVEVAGTTDLCEEPWGDTEHSEAFKCLRESQRTCGNKIAVALQEDMSHRRWSAIRQPCSSSLPSP